MQPPLAFPELAERATQRERQVYAGKALFKCSFSKVEGVPDSIKIFPKGIELGHCFTVEYMWRDPLQWQIVVRNDTTQITRRLVCDGSWVDTNSALWSTKFLTRESFEIEEELSEEDKSRVEDLTDLFQDEAWPYCFISKEHLFPFTSGRTNLEGYLRDFPVWCVQVDDVPSNADGAEIIRAIINLDQHIPSSHTVCFATWLWWKLG